MSAFFIAFWKGEERKNKSRESDMKTRMDFCIVFCMCRKEYGSVKESDLQRASKILRTEFGSDWKQIVQTLGTRELTHCVGQDLTSFMAFPERAEGGNNQWRGNCSPQVVAKLIQFVKKCRQYEKKKDFLFLDPMSGSGTSQDVAEKLHISSVLYDLNPHPPKGIGNWNALKDEVMHSADPIFFHPPYHDIIRYSGNMWGRPHEDDLSRCENYEDYIEKLNYVIKKLYFSLRHNGYLAILVGDIRQKGIFHSIAADMLHIGNMKSWIVKGQFHCTSNKKQYSGKPFIPIVTETLVLFQKEEIFLVPFSIRKEGTFQIHEQDSIALTWFHLLRMTMEHLDGHATLKQLYQELREHPKAKKNKNYEARIRATLYEHADCFLPLARGTFRLKYR